MIMARMVQDRPRDAQGAAPKFAGGAGPRTDTRMRQRDRMAEPQGGAAPLQATTYADLRRRMLFFAVVFSLFVFGTAVVAFASLRASALRAAEARAQSYSDILSDHLARTM